MARQILLQQLCPAQEGVGSAKSLLKLAVCVGGVGGGRGFLRWAGVVERILLQKAKPFFLAFFAWREEAEPRSAGGLPPSLMGTGVRGPGASPGGWSLDLSEL